MTKAELLTEALVAGKLLGGDKPKNGRMLAGGLEVLADGENVAGTGGAAGGVEDIAHQLSNFVVFFAYADHDARLGGEAGGFGAAEDFEGAVVLGLGADGAVEAADGFHVVVEDVGAGVEDELKGGGVAGEVGDEGFDAGGGTSLADGADGLGPDGGTPVGQFVAVDGSDYEVAKIQDTGGLGDAAGFIRIEVWRATGGDVAEATGAGADVAKDHEGGGAAAPAFAEVRTFGGLADGV